MSTHNSPKSRSESDLLSSQIANIIFEVMSEFPFARSAVEDSPYELSLDEYNERGLQNSNYDWFAHNLVYLLLVLESENINWESQDSHE